MLEKDKTKEKKFAIVTTTINNPTLLDDYAADSLNSGYGNLSFIVVGDKKTDPAAKGFVNGLNEKYPFEFIYMDPNDQISYLKKYPSLETFLPWNCVQRRNVGILYAYEKKADIIITIDDDNFIAVPGFLDGHALVDSQNDIKHLKSDSKWLNICDFLEDKNEREFFVRGFPISERKMSRLPKYECQLNRKVVVNGGLWLGDPDIDAITRLTSPIDVYKYSRNDNFALDKDVWCPFNSQNTALSSEVIPAYFLSPHIGRFDDIWASYFVKRVADYFNHSIAFGFPLVKQERNDHNLWNDLELELFGNKNTERLVEWMRSAKITGNTYKDVSLSLINEIKDKFMNSDDLTTEERESFEKFIEGYSIWINLFR